MAKGGRMRGDLVSKNRVPPDRYALCVVFVQEQTGALPGALSGVWTRLANFWSNVSSM